MKVSKAKAEENRATVLRTAARLFRERGFDGVGVSELMKSAGLTNGAFYGQFESKDALIAETCEQAVSGPQDPWSILGAQAEGDGVQAFIDAYLSPVHVAGRGEGCLFAALGGEVVRQSQPAREAFTANLRRHVDHLAATLAPQAPEDARLQALGLFSTLLGGLILARAVDDPGLSHDLLVAAGRAAAKAA